MKQKGKVKPDIKKKIIYAIILVVILSSMIYYEHYTTKETRRILELEVQKINSVIKELESSNDLIQKNIVDVQGNISKLNVNLKMKESDIKDLTGEVQQVKIESQEQVETLQENIKNLKLQNQDFSDIIDNSIPAVISVRTDIGAGSGFMIDAKGYAVTNYHVIKGANAGSAVTSDGKSHAIRIVGYNSPADIAVLELAGGGFDYLRFGNSKVTGIGESVIAVGNPGGLDFTVTKGIVSAQREDSVGNKFIQIDVPINPGNSGGPLINAEGKVIGVNTKKISEFEGVGFALASNYVDDIIEDIIAAEQEDQE